MFLLITFCQVKLTIFLKVLASQKRLENKYKAAQLASEEWYVRSGKVLYCQSIMSNSCCLSPLLEYRYRKAQLALEKGEEDLAREALKRRKSNAVSPSSQHFHN